MKTISEIAQAYGLPPQLAEQWKKEILESAGALFEIKRGPQPAEDKDRLCGEIGWLKMEVDWLKKSWGQGQIGVDRWCRKLPVSRRRSTQVLEDADAEDLLLCRLIDEEYTNRPFYGSRRMVVFCAHTKGQIVNRKQVQRLTRSMWLARHGAGVEHEQAVSGAQDLSVPVAGGGGVPVTRLSQV